MAITSLWDYLFRTAQAEPDNAGPANGDADGLDSGEGAEGLLGADEALGPEPNFIEPISSAVPMMQPPPKTNPVAALSDTAETATEAAGEFVTWLGSGQQEALIATAMVVGFSVLFWLLRWLTLRAMTRLPNFEDYSFLALFQRVISRFHKYFMVAIAAALTDWIMPLPGSVSGFARIFFVLASVLQIAEWVQEFAVSTISRNLHRNSGDARALASAFNIIKWFTSFAIWAIALLLILDNVGADVTALLAGLGIGGIAIGIAAQGVFRDLFSSLSIVIDKPFQVGDMVRYGESWGAIEDIGLKSTRIRSRSGEQMVIANTNLLDFEIHNMTRMVRRRMETQFGVIYQTDPDLAERIPEIVSSLVRKVGGVEFERCGMCGFGPSSLDYNLSFFSLHPDHNRSQAALSRVLLALLAGFKEEGIVFAYPTQTLYVEGVDPPSASINFPSEE